MLRDLVELAGQLAHRHLPFAAVRFRVDLALPVSGQVKDGFPHGFGRDRPRVQTDPAHHVGLPLDNGDALVQLGRGNRTLLAGRTATNHQQVVTHGCGFLTRRGASPVNYRRLVKCGKIKRLFLSPKKGAMRRECRS